MDITLLNVLHGVPRGVCRIVGGLVHLAAHFFYLGLDKFGHIPEFSEMGVGWKFLPCDQLLAMVGHLGPGLFGEEEVAAKDCSCGFLVRLLKMRITIFSIS